MTFDKVVVNGKVLDGSGAPPFRADIGIKDGKIAEIGNLKGKQAHESINAEGRMVSPGFIDMHSHDDFNLPNNPMAQGKSAQGVTTVVTGNCGFSPAPVVRDRRGLLREISSFLDTGLSYDWLSFADFLGKLPPTGVNIAPIVGHIAIRCGAMEPENRPPTVVELERMTSLLTEAMEAGAFGISTGLIYPPSCYADTTEITTLARLVARFGGGYFTHLRDEGANILESIREAIGIGRGSGCHVQISHLKITHPANWGQARTVLGLIEEVREQGMAIACDQYPYTATSTALKTMLPLSVLGSAEESIAVRLRDQGTREKARQGVLDLVAQGASRITDWKEILISFSPSHPENNGMNLEEIAKRDQKQPVDAMLDLLVADKGKTLGIFFSIGEEDMFEFMRHPAVAIGSDGIFLGTPGKPDPSKPHPRYFGTFPRVIGRYAREQKILPLPEAIRKMTSMPADILGLRTRGRVEPGYMADLVVFDPNTVIDTATFQEPHRMPIGIETVLVNGVAVVEKGRSTENTPGIVLRKGEA